MRIGWITTGISLLAVAGGSFFLYLFLQPAELPSQLLYGNGHIEGIDVRVSAEVAGRITEKHFAEGQEVSRGDILFAIDGTDIDLRIAQAEAEIAALESERDRIGDEIEVWRHHLSTAETNLARYQRLNEIGGAAQQNVEQAENAVAEANGNLTSLQSQRDALGDRIEAAQNSRDLIENQGQRTQVAAPIDGAVLVSAAEVGEFVQPGQPLAVLVDLTKLTLKVYIPEKDIGKVTLEAPARVRTDSFPDQLIEAHVSRIDQQAQFTPRDIHMPEERVRTVFGVTLSLQNPNQVLKPGMPADAWILWQPDGEWPETLVVPQ